MSVVWNRVADALPAVADRPSPAWDDVRLVRACQEGHEQAWAALIDKYKNLIYSVPIRAGASPQDAADIFQSVCLQLFAELPRLRSVAALRKWLLTVATNRLNQLWRQHRRTAPAGEPAVEEPAVVSASVLEEVEREQLVRETVYSLPDRCRELVAMLFYEHPPRPYQQVAQQLGVATGSVGFIRGRCLAKLARALHAAGVK